MSIIKRIVCTDQEPYGVSPHCARIVSVGANTNAADHADESLTVAQVVLEMDQGTVFYTKGIYSGKIALVEKYWCSRCRSCHIRSHADAVKDNNLDELRFCAWKRAA